MTINYEEIANAEPKTFEEVMEGIEDNDLAAFEDVWNAAIETCAVIADHSLEHQLAHEYREYYKVK